MQQGKQQVANNSLALIGISCGATVTAGTAGAAIGKVADLPGAGVAALSVAGAIAGTVGAIYFAQWYLRRI